MSDEACYKVKLVWGKDLFYPDAKSKTTGFLSEECQLVCKLQSSEHASCRYPCFNRGFPFLRVTKRFFFMFFHVLIHGISLSFLWQPGFAGGLVFKKTWNICAHNRSRQCSRPCHQICSKKTRIHQCFDLSPGNSESWRISHGIDWFIMAGSTPPRRPARTAEAPFVFCEEIWYILGMSYPCIINIRTYIYISNIYNIYMVY